MIKSDATGVISYIAKVKIALLALAFVIAGGTLWFTHNLVQALQQKDRQIADTYVKSLQYLANAPAGVGDFSFIQGEIITIIDFPMIQTDVENEPLRPYRLSTKNIELDTASSLQSQAEYLKHLLTEMDRIHTPIKVTYQDTIILNYLHYGESPLIVKLRLLPYIEICLVALFVFIGYVSFSYAKRSEQSGIWVGMARETAHQLGTPISSMLGWVELLKEQTVDDAKAEETLRDMENDLHRLQKIAARFSKIGSKPDLHDEDLVDVIAKVTEYYRRRIPQTGKKVQLHIEHNGLVTAKINRELFEWVIENLTKNGLDAIETGEGRITYTISDRGNFIFVDVTDTGKGIDPKNKKDVFRPGFSTKQRGWGLGLSLARRIVESYHKGKLFLKESRPGVGTTFRIKLKK
ncbi:MAG TPA: HAMP domain-containing sensor histidine kinase [Bacteroidota bacterium]